MWDAENVYTRPQRVGSLIPCRIMFPTISFALLIAARSQGATAIIALGYQNQGIDWTMCDVCVAWFDQVDVACSNVVVEDLSPDGAFASCDGTSPAGCDIPFGVHDRTFKLGGCDKSKPFQLLERDSETDDFSFNSNYAAVTENHIEC
jgi:hypothetical protein